MKTLYFDCFAGASGNMILGGLVSLGVSPAALVDKVRLLRVAEFDIEFKTVDRCGISAVHAQISVGEQEKHRHLSEIEHIIDESRLPHSVKATSKSIFGRLARAEAKVHGIDVSKVHFHEVGALDAIIDIVGACVGFEMLGVDCFACSKINVGSGSVQMHHGKYPVPPPAVSELLLGRPFYSADVEGELTTPTGAAIITTLAKSYNGIPEIVVEQIGYGAGSREYRTFPNALRLLLGESTDAFNGKRQQVTVLETNLDDVSPQVLGHVLERALRLGALDCWLTPIQMKKNRPAVMLSVLCEPAKVKELSAMIYAETTTLGIRINEAARDYLDRETASVATPFGPIDVKIASRAGTIINIMPEYEQVRASALEHGVSFRTVHEAALEASRAAADGSEYLSYGISADEKG